MQQAQNSSCQSNQGRSSCQTFSIPFFSFQKHRSWLPQTIFRVLRAVYRKTVGILSTCLVHFKVVISVWTRVVMSWGLQDVFHDVVFHQSFFRLREYFHRHRHRTSPKHPELEPTGLGWLFSQKGYPLAVDLSNIARPWRFVGEVSEKLRACFLCYHLKQKLNWQNTQYNFWSPWAESQCTSVSSGSSDATDRKALTSNHFLNGSQSSSVPPHLLNCFDIMNCYACAQAYSKAVWSRGLKEYVPILNRQQNWSSSQEQVLETGVFIWIVEPTSNGEYYSLARIAKLNFGKDKVTPTSELET